MRATPLTKLRLSRLSVAVVHDRRVSSSIRLGFPKNDPTFQRNHPRNPSPVGSFSKTNPPANRACKRYKYLYINAIHKNPPSRTVGSFRRNTYIGPRGSCRLIGHSTKRDGGSLGEGGSPSKIRANLVPSAFVLLLFRIPRPYPLQRTESSKIINLRYTFIRRTLHSLNSLAVNFLTVRSSSFWYKIAQLVLSATS